MRNIYVDMDGVLAKWRPECSMEDVAKKDYFLNLEDEQSIIDTCRLLKDWNIPVIILSSALSVRAAWEKRQWLDQHGMADFKSIFVPYGDEKSDYVSESGSILVDDFGQNLKTWQGIPVKFYNGINGHGHTNYEYFLHYSWSPKEMQKILYDLATL